MVLAMSDRIFKYNIAMPVNGISDNKVFQAIKELKEVGYSTGVSDLSSRNIYLVCHSGITKLECDPIKTNFHFTLEEYNEPLFYALASILVNKNKLGVGELYRNINLTTVFQNSLNYNVGKDWIKLTVEEVFEYYKTKNPKSKGALIGYKLIKDFPGCSMRIEETGYIGGNKYYLKHDRDSTSNSFNETVYVAERLTDHFEPVYEIIKNVDYKLLTSKNEFVDIVISKDGVHVDSKTIGMDTIKTIYNQLTVKFAVATWSVAVTKIDIGCQKGIDMHQIEDIISIYDQHFTTDKEK